MRPKTVYQERMPQNTIALVNSAQGQNKGHLYKKLFYENQKKQQAVKEGKMVAKIRNEIKHESELRKKL